MPYSLSQINEAIRSDPKGFADQCDAAFSRHDHTKIICF